MKTITEENFKDEVMLAKNAVFVDFYAEWCGPCKITGPILENISKEIKNMKFVKVNVDNSPDLASQYSIFSIPTFLIFKEGKLVSQFAGAMAKEGFLNEINRVLGK